MARGARNASGITRRLWLLGGVAIPLSRALAAPSLRITFDGDDLYVGLPRLHFLSGRPMERLQDGASVVFLSQLTLTTDNTFTTVLRRAPERFVFSYDLWEEKFSVTKLGATPRTASGLTAAAAESWCMDSLAISASGLAADRLFWMRFELRAAEPKDEAAVLGEPGLNLTRLIEMFSRRPRAEQPHWSADAGPLRLDDIQRTGGRARNL